MKEEASDILNPRSCGTCDIGFEKEGKRLIVTSTLTTSRMELQAYHSRI